VFDVLNNAFIYLLGLFHGLTGSYGWAIVLLTVAFRVLLWPLNSAQMSSMKKMQALQPKLKALQDRYKDQPQKMQQEMMKFYAENKFNPFAGCLPLLIQLPIFIGLYGALNSPEFLAQAGMERFLFIDRLYHTLQGHGGQPLDGTFAVEAKDQFSVAKHATIVLKSGKTLEHLVADPNKALTLSPDPMIPGEPVTLKVNMAAMGLSVGYEELVKSLDLTVIDNKSRELEKVSFTNQGGVLQQAVPTLPDKTHIHLDVATLIALYGVFMILQQKFMSPKGAPAGADNTQAQMMKFMPLMFLGMLFFIPIPAGVMIYLVVTTLLMFVQTAYVNWRDHQSDKHAAVQAKPADQVLDIQPKGSGA
jgi:YidC/Oxa1 family membrane protein insertase